MVWEPSVGDRCSVCNIREHAQVGHIQYGDFNRCSECGKKACHEHLYPCEIEFANGIHQYICENKVCSNCRKKSKFCKNHQEKDFSKPKEIEVIKPKCSICGVYDGSTNCSMCGKLIGSCCITSSGLCSPCDQEQKRIEKEQKKQKHKDKWDKYAEYASLSSPQGGQNAPAPITSNQTPIKSPESKEVVLNNIKSKQELRKRAIAKSRAKKICASLGEDSSIESETVKKLLLKNKVLDSLLKQHEKSKHSADYVKYKTEYIINCLEIALNFKWDKSLLGPGYAPIDSDSIIQALRELPDDPELWVAHHGHQDYIHPGPDDPSPPPEPKYKGIPYSSTSHPGHKASDSAEKAFAAFHGRHAEYG